MVYLIHFDRPYKHAQHYIGFTDNLEQREHDHHFTCDGARLLQVVREAGIAFKVVRTWPDGDRNYERKLKNRKNASQLCPVCCELRNKNEKVFRSNRKTANFNA